MSTINRFALALFEQKLNEPPKLLEDLDSLLCMIAEGGIDIHPMLRLMEALPDDDLAEVLHRNWFAAHGGRISFTAFWSCEPAKTIIWAWYTSATLLRRMERAALSGNEKALKVHLVIATARANDAR